MSKEIIEEYFEGYAAAVVQSRALVSVEDGLKPSMRMALYANYTDKFVAPKKTAKFLKLIGSASRFCWHGDSSTFGMLIRSAKPFAMRYPLYDAQGSFGTLMSPDSHAAARYVEGRLNGLSTNLFEFLDKNVITEWKDNYDNTEQSPALLPSVGFWNLCNGTQGIGVGVSSSIPSFNLNEMNSALAAMILDEPYKLPMPDFATGGLLLNSNEVKESLLKGTGAACKLRAKIVYDSKGNLFRVTELPYATYTNTICKELEELRQDESSGIDYFNDATGQTVDLEIYLTKDAIPNQVLSLLYKKTSLQNNYSINLTMLEDCRKPRVYTLPEAMQVYLDYQQKIFRRAYEYDLAEALKKIHILEGYIIACNNIEEVVQLIKTSKDKAEAKIKLKAAFPLDDEQVDAILKLTLSRIASLEVKKFITQKDELEMKANIIKDILSEENGISIKKAIADRLRYVAATYGDDRRTELLNITEEQAEKLMYFTPTGKIYITPPKNESIIATIPSGVPYMCVTKGGIVYRGTEVPKRAKQVFKIVNDEIMGIYPYDENKYLVFIDEEGHFRCKELSTLNKIKTKLSLTNLKIVGITAQRASKQNYKQLISEEMKN